MQIYLGSSSNFDQEDRKEKALGQVEGRLDEYEEDEENLVCPRYPLRLISLSIDSLPLLSLYWSDRLVPRRTYCVSKPPL